MKSRDRKDMADPGPFIQLLCFIRSVTAVSCVIDTHTPLFTCPFDIVEDTTELLICQSHHGVEGSAAYGENSKESPALDSFCNQELLDVIECGVVSSIHASNDVEQEIAFSNEHVQCLAHQHSAAST